MTLPVPKKEKIHSATLLAFPVETQTTCLVTGISWVQVELRTAASSRTDGGAQPCWAGGKGVAIRCCLVNREYPAAEAVTD